MRVEIFNYSGKRTAAESFLRAWVLSAARELKKRKIKPKELNKKLIIAFVDEKKIKKLNRVFRNRNKITDVLSFSAEKNQNKNSFDPKKGRQLTWPQLNKEPKSLLGEIVLCPSYIKKKAKKNRTSVRKWTAYMALHGLLHLLGFKHEKSKQQAQRMFKLQDEVFEKLYTFS